MMMCASALIERLAIVVIATDCISQSVALSRITMRLLYITMNGVASIDSTMLASTGLCRFGGSKPPSVASASSTKPNSPACARYRPVRNATPGAAPKARASTVTSTNLNSTGANVSANTSGHRTHTASASSFMPIVMKNRPRSTSWNGRMSVSTWCLYSVSAISMPATNAPSASDRPACSVRYASASVTSNRLSMNSSSLLSRAMIVSHQRITRWPPTSSTVSSRAAFRLATASACSSSAGFEPSAGISTSSGTTAKSWNSSTPITRRPCSLSSSSRSAISLTTIAVLLIASAPPSATALCQFKPHSRPAATKHQANAALPATAIRIVSVTCDSPSPNTNLRMLLSLGRLNSSPITNIRNTTPNSAR